ncbi:nucleoporin Nup186/Nup192/Nup205 [Cytidiella melzeri]|nr:nucleoporin Nup186/Nup192/Nup205 [Cytidiella melzeri]
MSPNHVPSYDPAYLRATLLSVLRQDARPQEDSASIQRLFEELMLSKHHLVKLFDVGPRSDQERKEVEEGRITINNRPLVINTDFARQVVFVSAQLDVSERHVAGLMQSIIATRPNITSPQQVSGSEKLVEAAILEFHARRLQLAECLKYIVEAAALGQQGANEFDSGTEVVAGGVPEVYRQLELFVRQDILFPGATEALSPPAGLGFGGSGRRASTSQGGFPLKLLREIDRIGETMEKVKLARQNARSDTVGPSQVQGGTLGVDTLNARLSSLQSERRTIGSVLVGLCRLGYVSPTDLLAMVDWLQKNCHSQNPMVLNVMAGVMNCWESVDPSTVGGLARKQIAHDANLVATLKTKLNPPVTPAAQADWVVPGLRAVLLLKWTLFLTEMRHREPALEDRDGFKTDDLENQIWNGVQGDAFNYLVRIVTSLYTKASSDSSLLPTSYLSSGVLSHFEGEPLPISSAEVEEEFIGSFLDAVESLIRWMITYASSELRKIKQRQEDLLLAGVRSDRSRMLRSTAGHNRQLSSLAVPTVNPVGSPPRNDIAMLFSLIGVLYTSLPPERALQFWGGGIPTNQPAFYSYMACVEKTSGRLPPFLQWAVWSTQIKDVDVLTALYDMLVGLSKGQQCSELAYNFLARGGSSSGLSTPTQGLAVSWSAIFGLLEQWTASALSPKPSQPATQSNLLGQHVQAQRQHQAQPQQLVLAPKDVLLAQSFLRLLGSVVCYSTAVRTTLSGHTRFRPIPTLLSLIPLNTPLELKGALFDALSSFCLPGAGLPGVEICRSVWTLMERMEVINVRASAIASGPPIPAVKGVEVELEEVEAVHKMYPETIPFLKLLSTLIHTPKSVPARDLIADSEPLNTIPDALGHLYRTPGIGPYTSFVVDIVFAKISQREYLRPNDRWRINDYCLRFVENCLASFDLESLDASQEDTKVEALLALAVHPGHDILKRMLTNSHLQASILSYVVDGLDGFDKGFSDEEPLFAKTITRAIRIVKRVLELQDVFFDIFVPALLSIEDAAAVGEIHPVSYYIKFDQALLYGPDFIPALASYISYPAYPELRLLSVKTLSALATSSNASQLAVIISRSSDSDRILDGYQHILDTEALVDVNTAETIADECTGAGAPDAELPTDIVTQATRLAVLDFFNQNTQPGLPYPNVAHLLLFGGIQSENQIQDPNALGAKRACIHAILDVLNDGVPRLGADTRSHRAQSVAGQTLASRLPAFAERCYQVIRQLCRHSRTSEFTMRYLRSREDFFARHLAALPFHLNPGYVEPYIEIQYNDSSRVITSVPTLCASLRLRSIIFDLVALELHVLTSKGHSKSVVELLDLLYGNEDESHCSDPNWVDDLFKPFREVGQSYLRMIEFLQALDFDWSDSIAAQPVPLEFFGHLNLASCICLNNFGCEIVDTTALVSLLTHARRALHQQGRILTPAHMQQVSDETAYILQSCAVENHRRQVQHASMVCYESWRRLLEMTLVKCFEKIVPQRREGLLFDLLHVLPAALLSNSTPDSAATILAEATLSTITKLREDRHQQTITQPSDQELGVGTLPTERLFALLRSLLRCLMDNSHSEVVRGNIYASLVNYVNLITDVHEEPQNGVARTEDLPPEVVTSSWATDCAPSSLISGSMAILKPMMEQLVALLSRDATDGTEVWKTVAFVLLDSLVRLSHIERRVDVIPALGRPGFLTGFVRSLKDTDLRLQTVLKPNPDDLNPLYIFESKMSLLSRIAQSRGGAERLVESRLILSLAESDFIDARPELDQAFVDNDNFLPSAMQRYHQLILPSLQIVTGMVATLGSKHLTANNQALEFFRSHRDTIAILLKTEADDLSISILEEMRLLVSLGSYVLSTVPKTELASVSTGGYGGVHAAIINLAARSLGKRTWATSLKPTSDEEATADSIRDPAFGVSKFRVKVFSQLIQLRKAIVAYIGNASGFTEHEFTPILSPIVGIPRQDDVTSRFMVTVPTVGDAIDALYHIQEDLAQTLKQFLDFSAELASQDHALANIAEMLELPGGVVLEDLTVNQRQALIDHELQKWQKGARGRAYTLFESLEVLLLLIWRHLAVYADEGAQIQNLGTSMRIASSFNADSFRTDASRKLAPIVHRLSSMATENQLGLGWQSYERYMEIMSSRLKDAAGFHETPELSTQEEPLLT